MKVFNIKKIQKDLSDEQGVGTTFAMFMAVACIMTGGLAIDASNLYSVKQRLQSATDVAAHAAILRMIWPNEDGLEGSVSDVAIASLLKNMPESKFGVALQASDVNIGYWDATAKQFTASSTDADGKPLEQAVSVTSRLDGEVGNVVPTFILDMVGFDFWKVSANAIFVRDTPNCFQGGFIAGGSVNLASNNQFVNGFCIHGNQGVDVNSHNSFGSGVVVSMPDSRLASEGGMFDLKGTGHTWADGYDQQVANQYLTASLASVDSLTGAINALTNTASGGLPPYVTVSMLNHITLRANSPLQMNQLVPNAVNVIDCPNKG